MKKTLVLGASPNPERYSHLAVQQLLSKGYEVVPVGIRDNTFINDLPILVGQPEVENVHTITLYLNATRQQDYYKYILGLRPKRIIFNPGTENLELMQLAKEQQIDTEVSCTLVLLSTGQY